MTETTQTVLTIALLAPAGAGALLLWIRVARAVRRARRTPSEPAHPVEHVGATESFAQELRGLRDMEVSPELVSDIETELAWGQAWHDFERSMQAEVDRIFAPALAFAECATFAEIRELVHA